MHTLCFRNMVPKRLRKLFVALVIALTLCCAFIALNCGSIEISFVEVLSASLGPLGKILNLPKVSEAHLQIILQLRLPRVLLAGFCGGGLALAGAALQGLFRNPLADPALIGISSGGAVGAGLVMLLGAKFEYQCIQLDGPLTILIAAAIGSICSTYLVYLLSKVGGRIHVPTMLLCGIAINALGGAIIGLMLYFADFDTLRDITFWGMGSFARAPNMAVFISIPLIASASILLIQKADALNILLLGNAEAIHLGINPHPIQRQIILLCGTIVGLTVALCGAIAFVGLVIPHFVRLLVGPNHRYLLPASIFAGATLMILVDVFSRSIFEGTELPIGIITAFVGVPFFLYLLIRARRKELA